MERCRFGVPRSGGRLRPLVVLRIACAAALLLTVGAGAARAEPDATNRLRIGLRERLRVVGDGVRPRGRFHLKIRGTTAAPCTTSCALRIGDLSIDVPLVRGRSTRRGVDGPRNIHARVKARGERLAVDVWGARRDDVGAVLAPGMFDEWTYSNPDQSTTACGLFSGEVVLDGVAAPVVVGAAGRLDVKPSWLFPDQERRASLAIVAAGFCPDDAAAAPVVRFVPARAGGSWDGRARGAAFAVGAAPTLSYATSTGRMHGLDAWESPDVIEVGAGQSVGDGVTSLALPGDAAYMVRFDAAVQTQSGPQSLVVRAETADGRRGRRARDIDVPVADPPLVADLNSQALEVRADGIVWASGFNGDGEVGDGTDLDPVSPVPLVGPTDVLSVGAGFGYSLAVDGAGQVWIWGDWEATVVSGGLSPGRRPMPFAGLVGITAVAVGGWNDALALDRVGAVWALNQDDAAGNPVRPRRILGLPRIQAIANSLALDRHGRVWDIAHAPVLVDGLPAIQAVSAGEAVESSPDVLALGVDGSVWSWAVGTSIAPKRVPLPRTAVAVSAGWDCFGALLDDGSVWTWITPGSQGDAAADAPTGPARVRDLDGIVKLWIGSAGVALAVDGDGETWEWDVSDADLNPVPPGAERPTLAPRAFRPGHYPAY